MAEEPLRKIAENTHFEVSTRGYIVAFVPFTTKTRATIKATIEAQGFKVTGEHIYIDKTMAYRVQFDVIQLFTRMNKMEINVSELLVKKGPL